MAASIEKLKKSAEKYVSKGKIEAAIKEYTKVLEETPKDINVLNRLGDLHARIKRTDEAARLFTGIAEQYTEEGFFVKAIAIYKKIIKLDPSRLEIYEKLADLYHKQGLINEARTQYQVLADYYLKHDNAASAISIYQKMVNLEPDNPSHHAKLAELYHQQKLPDKAIERYQKIADIMLRHGQGDQAGQVFERAFDVHSGIDFVSKAIAKLREAGHQGIAARVLAKAIEHNPEARSLLTDEAIAKPAASKEGAPKPAAAAPAPVTAAVEVEDEGPSIDLDVDDEDDVSGPYAGDDLQAAMAAAAASVEDDDIEIEDEDDDASPMDLELEDFDEEPESLIQPPDDMADKEDSGLGFNREFKAGMDTTGFNLGDQDAEGQEGGWDLDLEDVAGTDADGPSLEDEIELEIELDDTSFELEPEAEDLEEEEEKPALAEDDILSEAEVMTKYGLREKALERIHQVLSHNDRNLMAHRLLIQMHLEDEDAEEVQAVAQRMAGIAIDVGDRVEWPQVREMLQNAGYGVAELPDVPEPVEEPIVEETTFEEAAFEDDLVEEAEPEEPVEVDFDEVESDDEEIDLDDFASAEDVATEAEPMAGAMPTSDAYLDQDFGAPPFEPLAESPALASPFELGDLSDPQPAAPSPQMDTGQLEAALADAVGAVSHRPAASVEEAAASIEREVAAAELFSEGNTASGVVVELPTEKPQKPEGRTDRINRLLDNLLEETSGRKKRKSATEKALEDLLSETLGSKPKARPPAEPVAPAPQAPPASTPPQQESAPQAPPAQASQPPAAQPPAAQSPAPQPPAPQLPAPQPPAPAAPPSAPTGSPVKMVPRPAIDADDVSDIDDALSFLGPSTPPAPAPSLSNFDDSAARNLDDTSPASLEDSGMSWLDNVAEGQPGQAVDDSIFDDEEGFFDLASELGDEAMAGVFDPSAQSEPPEEQSLDEIISGFKRGVAENLAAEDVDTHFNLGIAYREMGLLDEAIGEFQVAAKGESHLVQSCSMLGICFQEKGLPELAIKWYTRGLAAANVSEQDSLALLYDLGCAYLATGDTQKARQTFVEVYGINSNYRDISAKLAAVQNS